MTQQNSRLSLGSWSLPPDHIATIVTYLQMTEKPRPKPASLPVGSIDFQPFDGDTEAYRALFRRIGEDWLWSSRLAMSQAELAAILTRPQVEVHTLVQEGQAIGLAELDFRVAGECELTFFGLAPEAIGRGLGRALMDRAIGCAWAKPIRRFWLHTCTLDHPAALAFYQRSGFRPYAIGVDVERDPRLAGLLPRTAGPHIPLIEG